MEKKALPTAWENFIAEVFGPDPETIRRAQSFLGRRLVESPSSIPGRDLFLIRDENGQEICYRYRDHAAAILGGYEHLFRLNEAGIAIMTYESRRKWSEKIRSQSALLEKIMSLLLEAGVPIPTGPQDRPATSSARPNPAMRSHAFARRRPRPAVNGTNREGHPRSTGPSVRSTDG